MIWITVALCAAAVGITWAFMWLVVKLAQLFFKD